MTPEQQADFANEIRGFPPKDIDRLHRVLFRLQEDLVDFTPAAIEREYNAICSEDRHTPHPDDPCLRWLLDLLQIDADIPLNEKFLDALQEAHIVLTTDGTTTDGGTDYDAAEQPLSIGGPSVVPERLDSSDLLDENDALWQQAVALDNRKLASQALEQWRQKLHLKREAYLDYEDPVMNNFADHFYVRTLARKTLTHWHNTVAEIQEMEKAGQEFRARQDASFALRQWTLAARERLFTRVGDERSLYKVLGIWREKTRQLREMEAAADGFRDRQVVRNTLGMMVAKSAQIHHEETQAVVVYQGNLVRRIFNKWLAQLQQIQLNERRADAAAEYFASKHALQKWREKTGLVLEQKRGQQARRQLLAVKYVRKWKVFARKSKEEKYAEAYKVMRRKVKVNIARAALNLWREKTARIREMDMTAEEFRARKDADNVKRMAHGAIVTMYNRPTQQQEANRQADLFFTKKLVERLQIFGSNWLVPTRQILENQKKADAYRATRTASHALATLRNWRNAAFRFQRLEEDAEVVLQRNAKKRALVFLQKWSRAAAQGQGEEEGREERMIPATPAARRSQLLASTTPAYTPAVGLFREDRVVEELDED
ncbi:hypothetical protein A1O3_06583 [Capronia epimyces CBS 606.96]|uniref:Sfi1 spindle body domain-containing protein n=1 Tax=Capronia epimyces CBS 606.96 TaxID=1182542 RepID=W9XRA6_9EURO|nr:uncharacterized protein A1O3_06583 [Capronia epimyces CBS 606.96]EXJ82768.1 hypothetical protein A1O3_06583 [Capronia epimyces CBS 606.96]